MTLISLCIILIITFFWLSNEYYQFEENARYQKKEYLKQQKELLRIRVERFRKSIQIFRKYIKSHPVLRKNPRYYEKELQKIILIRLGEVKFEKHGYMFAGTWDGISLLGPQIGKSMLHIQDPNGVKIVEKLIQRAKEGGDLFIT